jgi:adenine/guanine phosphoribosyltransferase-like PRPP-binding protein
VDDVISTGESLKAMETLVKKAGGKLMGKAAILAEGERPTARTFSFWSSGRVSVGAPGEYLILFHLKM